MGLYFAAEGHAAQNAVGVGFATPILIGPTGYTDAVFAAWTTIAPPVGWAAAIANAAGVIQLQWNGAAGQTVVWSGYVLSFYMNGATV